MTSSRTTNANLGRAFVIFVVPKMGGGASLTPLDLPVPLPQRIEGAASGDEFLLDVNWVRNNRGRLMLMSDRFYSSRDFEAKKYLWFLRCRVDFFSNSKHFRGGGN